MQSDGSRIEGCHKAWNALQRAQPSGVIMLTALSHDFVHRRNIQIAHQHDNSEKTPFVGLTAGSHHTGLVYAVAVLHNQLRAVAGSQCTLPTLPQLHCVDSGETFGLAASEHISTFGGLVKEEVNDLEIQLDTLSHVDASSSEPIAERAIISSREFIFNELNIDPKLLELPQVSIQSQITTSTTLTSESKSQLLCHHRSPGPSDTQHPSPSKSFSPDVVPLEVGGEADSTQLSCSTSGIMAVDGTVQKPTVSIVLYACTCAPHIFIQAECCHWHRPR